MTWKIGVMGGDEFQPGCADADRALIRATGTTKPKVIIVPTAAAYQSPSKAASNGVAYFKKLGADASSLMVLEDTDADDVTLLRPMDSADLIFLTGGDPKHLLSAINGTVFSLRLRAALERGAVVAGSSAGAMVLGGWMVHQGISKAVGLVENVAVLPHHERSQPSRVAKDLADNIPPRVKVFGIDAMTACIRGRSGWKVVGPGKVTTYTAGSWQVYRSGDQFPG
ncbi:MAG: Type 1 glutamine amidotransferase-like domain-containing protein [Chloroflexi bacterium]|nr:Type 1 glutamine amidotransferase-like domain-containing protein [Chloroflexota bacterium]